MTADDGMVERAARSLWETERWHFMETFDADLDSVKDYYRGRARAALHAALEDRPWLTDPKNPRALR